MNEIEQRIVIAEACGWVRGSIHHTIEFGLIGTNPNGIGRVHVPDYLNDLNAMHEAEKTLEHPEAYISRLLPLLNRDIRSATPSDNLNYYGSTKINFCVAHASARQRAEAFLRTIGKWKDGFSDELVET